MMEPVGPAGLLAGLSSVAVMVFWSFHRRRRQRQIEQEYRDAYRTLRVTAGVHLEAARFSYRPATRELKLDALAASLHGMPQPRVGPDGFVTLRGWHELPAAAGVAGWIDEALAEGLCTRKPVECEYRARAAGQADRYLVLHAVPLRSSDVLVGALAQTRAAQAPPGRDAWPVDASGEPDMQRAWLPGPRAAGPPTSAAP